MCCCICTLKELPNIHEKNNNKQIRYLFIGETFKIFLSLRISHIDLFSNLVFFLFVLY